MTRHFKDFGENVEAGVVVDTTTARLVGNEDNHVLANSKGVTISGPMSFPAGGSQIRFGALWVMQRELLGTIPSTMATPIPQYVIRPPIAQIASLMAECALMQTMMG